MACKKKLAEEKKEVVTDEALENVTGGALAGLSASPVTTEINFTEPTSPYAATTAEAIATPVTVKDANGIEIPVFNGTPAKIG